MPFVLPYYLDGIFILYTIVNSLLPSIYAQSGIKVAIFSALVLACALTKFDNQVSYWNRLLVFVGMYFGQKYYLLNDLSHSK